MAISYSVKLYDWATIITDRSINGIRYVLSSEQKVL